MVAQHKKQSTHLKFDPCKSHFYPAMPPVVKQTTGRQKHHLTHPFQRGELCRKRRRKLGASMQVQVGIKPQDDTNCGWTETLSDRNNVRSLDGRVRADWVIIGAGFTGLSFAHRLAELNPQLEIVVVDALRAGEGASSRNSGFLVDVSQFWGKARTKEEEVERVQQSFEINQIGINYLDSLRQRYEIECDWAPVGKFHATAELARIESIIEFAKALRAAGVPCDDFDHNMLCKRLGTSYYVHGIQTRNTVMIQPAALVRGLIDNLPENVTLLENSPVNAYELGEPAHFKCSNGEIVADNAVFATNAFLPQCGVLKNRLVPIALTVGMTRVLTQAERDELGNPEQWGVLSGHQHGATVRYTADHRIMVRNTAEYWPKMHMDDTALRKRCDHHKQVLRSRFPMLPDLEFEYAWAGLACTSNNITSVYDTLAPNVHVLGCYNTSGIARGAAFGKALAEQVSGISGALQHNVSNFDDPVWMPGGAMRALQALGQAWQARNVGKDL